MIKTATPDSIRAAKEFFEICPEGRIRTGIRTDPTWTKEKFARWFRNTVHRRVNRTDTRFETYRKFRDDYQVDAMRLARQVNTPGLIIDWIPPRDDWRSRFAVRMRNYESN